MVIRRNNEFRFAQLGGSQLSLRYHARLFEYKKNLTEIIPEIHLTEIVKFQTCQTTLPTPQNPFLAGGFN